MQLAQSLLRDELIIFEKKFREAVKSQAPPARPHHALHRQSKGETTQAHVCFFIGASLRTGE